MKQLDFIHSKLNASRKMVEENNIDSKKLSGIKMIDRRDILDIYYSYMCIL